MQQVSSSPFPSLAHDPQEIRRSSVVNRIQVPERGNAEVDSGSPFGIPGNAEALSRTDRRKCMHSCVCLAEHDRPTGGAPDSCEYPSLYPIFPPSASDSLLHTLALPIWCPALPHACPLKPTSQCQQPRIPPKNPDAVLTHAPSSTPHGLQRRSTAVESPRSHAEPRYTFKSDRGLIDEDCTLLLLRHLCAPGFQLPCRREPHPTAFFVRDLEPFDGCRRDMSSSRG